MKSRYNWIYTSWNLIVVLLIIYVSISLPLNLAFKTNPVSTLLSSWVVSVIFILDFIINILRLSRNRKNILCEDIENKNWYQSTLTITDFLAAIPFEMITPLPFFRLFKLVKLVRLNHFIITTQRTMIQYASTFSFISFAFWFIIAIHALACGWENMQLHHIHSDFATNYINGLYWTITTLTTVGYGDITPITNAQKVYAIFVQIAGFGVFTFVIGTVASRLMRKDPARVRYEENVDGLVSLMHFKTLPKPLRVKIMDFYKYMWKNRLGYDETSFLHSLPENIQTEVALCLKKEVIEKVSIFQNASEEFKRQIALQLKPMFLTPGDYIFKANDIAEEMYFVVNGELNTLTQTEDRIITKLSTGDFFGEIALFKNQNRSATIKAVNYCDIYTLDKISFNKVIRSYPEIGRLIKATVEARENNYSV